MTLGTIRVNDVGIFEFLEDYKVSVVLSDRSVVSCLVDRMPDCIEGELIDANVNREGEGIYVCKTGCYKTGGRVVKVTGFLFLITKFEFMGIVVHVS